MQLVVPPNAKRMRRDRKERAVLMPQTWPPFCDYITLLILARLPSSKYCDLHLVSRHIHSLIRNGEFRAMRKILGLKMPKIKIFLHSGEARYQCYEPYTRSCWDLPVCPYDETTTYCCVTNKLLCVGAHLLVLRIVSGNNNWGYSDIWRYELELNQWFECPMMNTPRNFFASADCGSVACVAGGEQLVFNDVLNSAEKYNPESNSWQPLPSMNMRRKFCSGFYMDSKFYVIGGRNENSELLTSGECYDFEQNVWEVIPNMIEDDPAMTSNSLRPQYHVAVVNNELYHFDVPSRHLKVYMKNNNTWKIVGRASASIESFEGCRVTLKPLGDELVLICGALRNPSPFAIIMCYCRPSPELDDVEWLVLDFSHQGWHPSIDNCCVMMA